MTGALRLEPVGAREHVESVAERVREAARAGERLAAWIELEGPPGGRGYLKGAPLDGKARLRHRLRELARRPLPRVAELANLGWLRARGFRAPEALAAGALRRGGTAVYQFLLTAEVAGARTLDAALANATPDARLACVRHLGRLVRELHALGFVHRDLYPRNVLVTGAPEDGELHLLDAWRGGARRQLRGPAHDHACLMLEGAELLTPAEQQAYFDAAFEGHPEVLRDALLGAIARERAALVQRTRRRAARRRRPPVATVDWDPRGLQLR